MLSETIVEIITAPAVDTMMQRALDALAYLLYPESICLLVWDVELDRYIVGETWWQEDSMHTAARLRRQALKQARSAYHDHNIQNNVPFYIEAYVFQALNVETVHAGLLVITGLSALPAGREYVLLVRSISQALYNSTRLEQADREHAELLAEREHLEQLLKAVDQQQRTIDRLLLAERQLSASLEARVEERTAELKLAQRQLIQSEKLAVIGKLAGSLAHEINNPLQAIQSGLGLVMDALVHDEGEDVMEDLQVIQEELERIQGIFRQLLDLKRSADVEMRPLDVNPVCESVYLLVRKKMQQANIKLELNLSENIPSVCGDTSQIKQVVLNLVLNASEAMPVTGGTIRIQTQQKKDRALVQIADDGNGIPAENLKHLFEPLFTTKTRGLGLGLAISQDIIRRHRGQIYVESKDGSGTIFTIDLPALKGCADEQV